jgi:hypothetical protein
LEKKEGRDTKKRSGRKWWRKKNEEREGDGIEESNKYNT